jgi:hypothetical protein
MQVTFIGTGNAFSRRYGHTNALVEAGEIQMMVDFGHLAPRSLEQYNGNLGEVTHVLISHIHSDHTGGLEELAFISRFVLGGKPTLLLPDGLGDQLWDHSLRGGLEWISDDQGQAMRCTLDDYFNRIDLGTDWQDLGPISIKTFRTDHVPGKDSWGFIVRDTSNGEQMIFGCDTRTLHPKLLENPLNKDFAKGPIFHDCQLSQGGPWNVHLWLDNIVYPPQVQERIVLVHYEDTLEEHLPAIRKAGFKVAFPGEVIHLPDWRANLRW